MSQHSWNDLGWGAGSDGASLMSWPMSPPERPEDDYEDLMGAWLAERGRVVEAVLLLARVREVLGHLVGPGTTASGMSRRNIRHLLNEIDNQLDQT